MAELTREQLDDARAWRAWNAWRYVLHAVAEVAPEALEDLARLVVLYREVAAHLNPCCDWESLAVAVGTQHALNSEELAKLKAFQDALRAWGDRWNLAHPEPLSWAQQNLSLWAVAPELAGKPLVFAGPTVDMPRLPAFRPPELPLHSFTSLKHWPRVEKALREYFEAWLAECKALYSDWALPNRELLKHARWWVAHRVRRWSIRTLHERAKHEGLVKGGHVIVEEGSPAAISEAIERLDRELFG